MEPVPITSIGTDDSDETKLEEMLKKALQNEHYELASKIRDVLKIQKNQQ
jgi:protein-arginine kinase activator protein McsA